MNNQKEKTEVVKIRLGSDDKAMLQKLADENERTLAGQIRLALGQWIENQEGRDQGSRRKIHYVSSYK